MCACTVHVHQIQAIVAWLVSNYRCVLSYIVKFEVDTAKIMTVTFFSRLAKVQEKQSLEVPQLRTDNQAACGADGNPRTTLLSSIQAIIPDHTQRAESCHVSHKARGLKNIFVVINLHV